MAVQRVDGYVFSCSGCGAVGERRLHRGEAVQDELDHHRQIPEGFCGCPTLTDHQHHRPGCDGFHLALVAAARQRALEAGSR